MSFHFQIEARPKTLFQHDKAERQSVALIWKWNKHPPPASRDSPRPRWEQRVEKRHLDPAQAGRHTLIRYTAVKHLAQLGVDLPTVQHISEHKTLAMVVKYAHQNGKHIRAAMDKLENRLAGHKTA